MNRLTSFSSERLLELANSTKQENSLVFKKMRKISPDKLDTLFYEAHQAEFEHFDCLDCANCCKSISPAISHRDVDRMAKGLGVKPSVIVADFLKIDSDGDYVFRSNPCPFLQPNNYCIVYEFRPKACREYPHTDRRRMHQILEITKKNISVCPVVFGVIDRLKKTV